MRLIYFPFAGRGEAIRDALRIGGVEFEDVRVTGPEFHAMRAAGELPFDTLPVLILDDGTRIGQSNAILRYVAQRAGLTPSSPSVAAEVDAMLDSIEDLGGRVSVSIRVTDDGLRSALRHELADRWLPDWFRLLERQLSKNGSGWLVGDRLTVADLKLVHWIDKLTNGSLTGLPTTLLDGFPILAAWYARARAERAARLG